MFKLFWIERISGELSPLSVGNKCSPSAFLFCFHRMCGLQLFYYQCRSHAYILRHVFPLHLSTRKSCMIPYQNNQNDHIVAIYHCTYLD